MSGETNKICVTINRMEEADLPEVMDIEKRSFPSPWSLGLFQKELQNSRARCLCARVREGNRSIVAAYIIFWIIAGEAHLHNLAVGKDYRGQGVAYELMQNMKQIAAADHATLQTLEVRASNAEAIRLYEKCGFVVKGIRRNYYSETHENALIMWADINKG